MRRLLSIDYQRRVTHAERAPMRSRPDCGTDMEEVSIGGARRFSMVSKVGKVAWNDSGHS